MTVEDVRDVLLTCVPKAYHYMSPETAACPYAVYGEVAAPVRISADDGSAERVIRGEIYYFTRTEFDGTADEILAAMEEAGAAVDVTSIGYDPERREISYEISWEVPCGEDNIYRGGVRSEADGGGS